MVKISVFGRGNMGKAVGGVFDYEGNQVEYFGHDSQIPDELGEVVILGTQYKDMAGIIEANKDKLKGKIVVDISNPVNFQTMDDFYVPMDSSAAQLFQDMLPESTVIKAFNTNFFDNLLKKTVAGQVKTTVQMAGDDEAAKARLRQLIEAGGINVVDAGPLRRSRELEAMGYLQIVLAVREQVSFEGGYAILK